MNTRILVIGIFVLLQSIAANAQCINSDNHVSPVDGGIALSAGVRDIQISRGTGNVPFMKAAYNRNSAGWLDNSLNYFALPDRFVGKFPLNNSSKFGKISGKAFGVRVYGYYSDSGTVRPFARILKNCTSSQTAIIYYNDYDRDPNVVVIITWDTPFSSLTSRPKFSMAKLLATKLDCQIARCGARR